MDGQRPEKNPVIQSLFDRKSVRVYEEREIEPEKKQLILEAACQAPSAGNQQLYTILDITDQQLKERLSVTCDNQPFIARASLVLIFCADAQKWYDAYRSCGLDARRPEAGDILLAMEDAAIAAQNAVTAAESLGIGSCYIGDILENCEIHRELLCLPDYVIPAVMVVFGYPTRQQRERTKPRRAPMESIVHENRYRQMDGRQLKKMLEHNAPAGNYDDWLRAFCDRKYMSDFSREMSRSAKVYLEKFMKSNTP